MSAPQVNTRILVIDDEESVRDGIRAILQPPRSRFSARLVAASRQLFDDELQTPFDESLLSFKVDTARHGQEGIAMIDESAARGEPYAVIFCDMRMPGLDGLETIEAIRRIDPHSEIVFVTAFSDHSLTSITERVGANVSYLGKPFFSEEIRQLATKLVLEWNQAREAESLIGTLTSLRGSLGDADELARQILQHLCGWLGTDTALLVERDDEGRLGRASGAGAWAADPGREAALALDPGIRERYLVLPLPSYGLIIAERPRRLDTGLRFLLTVFLENAALALRSSRSAAAARQRERLAELGQALGFVVHDLKGSIAAIEMMVQILDAGSDALGSPSAVHEKILNTGARIRGVLEDTLDLCRGRSSPLALERTRLRPLFTELTRVWQLMLGKSSVKLTVEVGEALEGWVEPRMLERALWNLISNAADILRGRDAAAIWVSAESDGETLTIAVRDNGPGIPEPLRERVFAPFASGRGRTGFGLAIVRQIAEAHGGAVSLASGPDGTTFTLRLPAQR